MHIFVLLGRGSCWNEVFGSMSRRKVRDDPLCNVLREAKCLSKVGFDGWGGGMMKSSKGFESGQQLFSKVCVWVLFIFGFCCLAFQERVPWFLGTPKNCNSPLILQGQTHKGWVWFFVRILEAVIGGSQCVIFMSSILSSGAMMSRKLDCVIFVGWRIYNTVCKLKLEFPWKSNVVLDSCGTEDFEKKG